ncbi:uncharacterized protein PHALS_11353 [Plasmopara halstedii]|uniref:Uncharacterized protein n=1 Tax=Plasmopara halstedii TaxID=4781 RepID=A0A0P1A4P1_PLAHL|nr:uncharacterized protein PHALS_11353 [Plasmopara halstedii]CEG35473.1 hypothetical protein PHALS_11353 [Plasmopara halstedii]|eukprot:XP_024571842.1 hypothetical protein PHALS_11353 [Plasmopara halstedii]
MNPSSPPSSASTLPTSAPAPPTAALPPVTAAPAPTEALEPSVDDPKQEDSTINPGTSEISSSPETHQESEPSASNTTSSNPLTPLSISSGNDTYSGNSAISNTPENLSTNLVTKAEFRSIEKTDTELIGSVGKSTETQRTTGSGDNSAQTINNQSEEADSNHGIIGLAVGGGACAMLIAFGVIYQARKRAKGLEYEDKDVHFQAATP